MHVVSKRPTGFALIALLALPLAGAASAQQQDARDPNIVVNAERPADPVPTGPGPEVKGIITARHGDRIKVLGAGGNSTIVAITDATTIKSGGGFFGGSTRLGADSLLNGLPVTIRTLQAGDGLVASQVTLKNSDLKTAMMIRNGTSQQFEAQTAATEALRGRMGDIDKYNIKSTTNVYFDTGKAALSPKAKQDLCSAASDAENKDNALMLVVGYTDSTGTDEINQPLSEKRASSVINYLQQVCHWKPYRMLTPTGMATADPLAPNDTPEGKAQNRRVAVNVLVSKGLDGM